MTQRETRSISVVVPTFNDVGRLGDALTAIVGQTLPPTEIVISDDGSDDGTEKFVREFADRQAGGVEVRYIRLTSRSPGAAAARNEGVAVARGEWIACCDSDDVWAPTKLERQAEFLREWNGNQPIAILGTHGYNMNDAKKIISPARIGPTTEDHYNTVRRNSNKFVVLHSSILFSRSDFLAVGGYGTEYGSLEDADFVNRMAERGVVICLPEPLVYYRKRAGSMQVALFWDQRLDALRLTENQRRRAKGQAPLGRDEFAAQLASDPIRTRFRRRKEMWGHYYYRSGTSHIVNGRRLRGGLELVLASVMDGSRLRSGVRAAVRARLSRQSPAQPAADHEPPRARRSPA